MKQMVVAVVFLLDAALAFGSTAGTEALLLGTEAAAPDYIATKASYCSSLQQQLDEHMASGDATLPQKMIFDFLAINATQFQGKLLPWFDLNLQCLNVLYPLTIATVIQGKNMTESQRSNVAGIIRDGFAVHMSLGRTNWARHMGVPESNLNAIAWANDELLHKTMAGPFVPATELFCEKLQAEYDALLDLGDSMNVFHKQNRFGKRNMFLARDGWMYKTCRTGAGLRCACTAHLLPSYVAEAHAHMHAHAHAHGHVHVHLSCRHPRPARPPHRNAE